MAVPSEPRLAGISGVVLMADVALEVVWLLAVLALDVVALVFDALAVLVLELVLELLLLPPLLLEPLPGSSGVPVDDPPQARTALNPTKPRARRMQLLL